MPQEQNMLKLTNQNLENLLFKKDNLKIIEALLIKYFQEFKNLDIQKKDKKLDFGKKLSDQELKEIFSIIKTETDAFLGVNNIPTPSFGYHSFFKTGGKINYSLIICSFGTGVSFFDVSTQLLSQTAQPITGSFFQDLFFAGAGFAFSHYINRNQQQYHYSVLRNNVTLLREERTILIPGIAHEYTHFVQEYMGWKLPRFKGLSRNKRTCLSEGHAIGVENYLARTYAQRENNPAFLYDPIKYNYASLASTYFLMCKKWDIKERTIPFKGEPKYPSVHAKGNALFLINEAKYGPGIYADILKGKFELK